MEAVDIMRDINAQVAINAGSVEEDTLLTQAEKIDAMANVEADLNAEAAMAFENEAKAEASLEGKTKESVAAEITEILEGGTVEAPETVVVGSRPDPVLIDTLVKGYRGANGAELMRSMFLHLISVKPATIKDIRKEMCAAIDEKSVPARFLKKGLDKLVDCTLIAWDGDMKGTVTWT
jgi:hypothetical protein